MEATTPEMLSRINKRNEEFWSEQNKLREQRMVYLDAAYRSGLDEAWLPLYDRPSFERMLERAEEVGKLYHNIFSSKGGRAAKPDALQQLILGTVRDQPEIRERQLLRDLASSEGISPIQEITQEDIILDTGKVVPLSGLKDRLSRAKKAIAKEKEG